MEILSHLPEPNKSMECLTNLSHDWSNQKSLTSKTPLASIHTWNSQWKRKRYVEQWYDFQKQVFKKEQVTSLLTIFNWNNASLFFSLGSGHIAVRALLPCFHVSHKQKLMINIIGTLSLSLLTVWTLYQMLQYSFSDIHKEGAVLLNKK